MLLKNLVESRDNNFNLIRLIAATFVLYSHSFAIVYGGGEYEPLRSLGITFGRIAVDIFFVTSGFLITRSFLRSEIRSFILKRVLRIYPALLVSVIFMVIAFSGDILHPETFKFVAKNVTLVLGVHFQLPGAFLDAPFGPAVNGSLWTMPWEVRCYIALTLIASFKPKITLPIVALAGMVASLTTELAYASLIGMFFTGASFYMWRHKIFLSSTVFVILCLVVLLSLYQVILFKISYTLAIPYITFFLAYIPKGVVRKFNSVGDYSYGVYIYAFPVQQFLTYYTRDILTHIVLSLCITFLFAFFSWHFVEKKCMRIKIKLG